MAQPKFTVVVLAADRGKDDPVARAAGVPCKALAEINGKPMLIRVLDTLNACTETGPIILCGPTREVMEQSPVLEAVIQPHKVDWAAPGKSPATSVETVLDNLKDFNPVIVTTADHGLLEPHMVTEFCTRARQSQCDAVIGLVDHERIKNTYPEFKKTVLKFRDGDFCGCNLFAFLTPRGRKIATFWRKVESDRKNPVRVINALGLLTVLRYLLGKLSLGEALDKLSTRVGIKVGAVLLPYPQAAVDVDTEEDWIQVQKRTISSAKSTIS